MQTTPAATFLEASFISQHKDPNNTLANTCQELVPINLGSPVRNISSSGRQSPGILFC
jgi:hypothetical protein